MSLWHNKNMKIEFGKIINDSETKRKCLYWYSENIKTLEDVLKASKLSLKLIYQNDFERIYLLNNEAFIYAGIISKYYTEDEYAVSSNRGYGVIAGYIKHGNYLDTSEILICELTYNSYQGIHKSVFTDVSRDSGTNREWIGYPDIVRNYPYISKYGRNTYEKCFEYCKGLINGYNLQHIIETFEGAPMCVAVYKIEDTDGSIGYASYCFASIEKAHDYARKCIKDHLIYCQNFVEGTYKYGAVNFKPHELVVSDEFKNIFKNRTTLNGSPIADVKDAFQYIKYCLVNVNDNPHPNIEEIEKRYELDGTILPANYGSAFLSQQVFEEAKKGAFTNYDYFSYTDGKVKWKSEFLVYQIVKKLFPAETVYQYRPLFLKTEKGQMSYDIFISGLNIAIEYQGKQHFEPVNYFGGQESFKDNVKRDELKKHLSELNNVKLIYISYKETINEKLITEKINQIL